MLIEAEPPKVNVPLIVQCVLIVLAAVLMWRILVVNNNTDLTGPYTSRQPTDQRGNTIARPAGQGAQPITPTDMVRQASERIARNPNDAAAMLAMALGLEAVSRANPLDARMRERATAAFDLAERIAPTDPTILGEVVRHRLESADWPRGIPSLARLLALGPRSADYYPVVARLIERGLATGELKVLFTDKAPWMSPLVMHVCSNIAQASAMLQFIETRIAAGAAPPVELECVIARLQRDGFEAAAYSLWISTLPPERSQTIPNLFNGSFEHLPTNLGYDWRVLPATLADQGHIVGFLRTVGVNGQRSLSVEYTGKRHAGLPIQQRLRLAPGAYVLSGMVRTDSMRTARGVQWVLRCPDQKAIMLSDRYLASSEWYNTSVSFKVPSGCDWQNLALENALPEEGVTGFTGTVTFDALEIRADTTGR
jgi:hypothetical protein